MILAIDTSIGTSVALVAADGVVIAERSSPDVRGHAESIGAFLEEVGAEGSPTAVAVGMGPGAYTGLRVGIAAARAFARGRDLPLLPVPSHDAVREELGLAEGALLATPAGRRGHYVSASGETRLVHDGATDARHVAAVSAAALARVALARAATGVPTGPEQPLYLREPDVTPSAGPKRVTG